LVNADRMNPWSPSLRLRRWVVAGIVILLAGVVAGCGVAAPLRQPDRTTSYTVLGAYAGYRNVDGVDAISHLVGHPVGQAMDFLDGTSWSATLASLPAIVPVWDRTGYRMTWGIPMLPDTGTTLARGAVGTYDHYFASIAQYLVAHHQGASTIRLGWEFNGFWFPWSAATCPTCFVTYWRRIVTTMRSVPGSRFRFTWNPTIGTYGLPPSEAYPGDEFVDLIGMDVYDNVAGVADPHLRWRHLLDEPFGLTWFTGFARAHHRPITFPEWGLGFPPDGVGDNPYFISHMAAFIRAQPTLVSALYWNYGTSALEISPFSNAAFAHAFGS
jgi:hypothetical protein